jgi:hypothetical protein
MKFRLRTHATIVGVFVAALGIGSYAIAGGPRKAHEKLIGFQEVPAISTNGSGTFEAEISKDETAITYKLSYANLAGAVTQSHIHFGQRGVNGAISVFLCTNLGNGPAGTQACPAAPATITGTIHAADVTAGAASQGIAAGEFAELIRAIRAGVTYANVHSATFPGGEIRAQLIRGHKGENEK